MEPDFRAYFAAWNTHDLDGVLGLFTDDIVFEDTTLGHVVHGIVKMRRFVQVSFDTLPDVSFEYVSHLITRTGFAVEWLMLPMRVRGLSIGTYRGGQISAQRDYWNGATFVVPGAVS